jgi:hypothetical protein
LTYQMMHAEQSSQIFLTNRCLARFRHNQNKGMPQSNRNS